MAAPVSKRRWRQAQEHERRFWETWQSLPPYQGLDLEEYWAGERRQFGLAADFFAGRKVVDVGCGPVGLIHFLPEAALRVRVDPLLIEYRERLPVAAPAVSAAAAAEALPLPSESMDVSICFNALDHMRDPGAALAEMRRVLRPGGTLLLMVHSFPAWSLPLLWPDRLHPHHWTHGGTERMLRRFFHVTRSHRARRHFRLGLREMLKPSGWKYAAGNFILWTSYLVAEKVF